MAFFEMKKIKIILLLAVFIGMILPFPLQFTSAQGPMPLNSQWKTQDVTLNGVEGVGEWSDATSVDLTLNPYPPEPTPPLNITAWIKNDGTWLYMLWKMNIPFAIDGDDGAYFNTLYQGADPAAPDGGGTTPDDFGGIWYSGGNWVAYDGYYTGTGDSIGNDGDAIQNVEGNATGDGTYHWYEFRKLLNSGDGQDMVANPGQTIVIHICFRDASDPSTSQPQWYMSNPISLTLGTEGGGGATFTIAHTAGKHSFMRVPGVPENETYTVTSVNNFAGTVNLTFHGPPSFESSSSVSPTSVELIAGSTANVILTLGTSASTPSGDYYCELRGQSDGIGKGSFFSVKVGAAGGVMLWADPSVIAAGNPTTFHASGFPPGEAITLKWDTGPKAGDNLTSGVVQGDGTWSHPVAIPADHPTGTFKVKAISTPSNTTAMTDITITGAGGGDDFLISLSPNFLASTLDQTPTVTVTLTSVGSFSSAISLTAHGQPPGVDCTFNPSSVTPAAGSSTTSTLTVTVNSWATPGMYHIMVEATSNPITKMADLTLDIHGGSGWGPSLSLSKSFAKVGDTVTFTGSNFPPETEGATVLLKETFTGAILSTTPSPITVQEGSFTGTFTVPTGTPEGNYRLKAEALGTPQFAESDFTIMGTGSTFNIDASPKHLDVDTEAGENAASTSIMVSSIGGSNVTVNLNVVGAPTWLTYNFTGENDNAGTSVTVTPGSSSSKSLTFTVDLTAPTGNYFITIQGGESGQPAKTIQVELNVRPPAGFGMAQFTLNPSYGSNGTVVTFSGSGFTNCTPSNVTALYFGSVDLITTQNITAINVPENGTGAGTFSGTFQVPNLPAGTYPVSVTVGLHPYKTITTSFPITGGTDTFIIEVSPSFLGVDQGQIANTMVTVRASGATSPNVALAVEGCPPDITPTFTTLQLNPPPGGVVSTQLSLATQQWAASGHYSMTVKGCAGAEVHSASLEMDVMPPQGYGMATVSINPTFGTPGTWVTITGNNFPPNTPAVFSLSGIPLNITGVTTSSTGSFSGVFQIPQVPPGMYPVDVQVGDKYGHFDLNIMGSGASFTVSTSPPWLTRQAGEVATVSINVQALNGSNPTVTVIVEGLPYGVTPSFTTWTVTPPVGGMSSNDLSLTISQSCPPGNYPISVKAVNVNKTTEWMLADFTLEVVPSYAFQEMGMATVTFSKTCGSPNDTLTVNGYGFPPNQNLTSIYIGNVNVTPSVVVTTDGNGDFSAIVTVPQLAAGTYPVEVEVQQIIRNPPFTILGAGATFTLKASPEWLEPISAGDPQGRTVTIIVKAMQGQTPNVTLSTDGLVTAFGSIDQTWNPSNTVSIGTVGGKATVTLTLKPSQEVPPGPYNFFIVGTGSDRFELPMELQVMPPSSFMGGWMGMDQGQWQNQWNNTEWKDGLYFPEVSLSPDVGEAGTQVSYSGSNFPANASITSITVAPLGANIPVPLPAGGLTADSNGAFTGSFIVNATWGLSAGTYWVEFTGQKGDWSQYVGTEFTIMASGAKFTFNLNPDWMPPIPPGGYGQTSVPVKAVGYESPNVTMTVKQLVPGVSAHWGTQGGPTKLVVEVPTGSQNITTLYLALANPGDPSGGPPPSGCYHAEVIGWLDSNGNQVIDPQEADSTYRRGLDFEVQPPGGFMDWDKDAMMGSMGGQTGWGAGMEYMFYFPEITLNPTVGEAGCKVSVKATDFPANATVTHLRFAGMELPVPANTTADSNGGFTLVFNVPKQMWGATTMPGWYDVEVEAMATDGPPVFIMKPFQVVGGDVAFTLRVMPDWLPPIAPGSDVNTTVFVDSKGAGLNVTLSVEHIPPGVTTDFAVGTLSVSPGSSNSTTLTLSPTNIASGHYHAEIKGVSDTGKSFRAGLDFEVQPPMDFMDKGWMAAQGVWFPEITLNPTVGEAGSKVTVKATDFPANATVTHLRFAGMELPIPAGTAADANGAFTLVFNVPTSYGIGTYMVEVEAQNAHPVFIAKPFTVVGSQVTFNLKVVPDWVPGVVQGESSNTTIFVKAISKSVTVSLSVDGLPSGVQGVFSPGGWGVLSVSPGSSNSSTLTLTTSASTPPGPYSLTIRGVSGSETQVIPFGFGVMPPAIFQMPSLTLNPDCAPAGYGEKKYKVSFSGTGFPANQNVSSLKFGGTSLPIPSLQTDANGAFTGVFTVPTGFQAGTYDVEVAVETGTGGYMYDYRPFTIKAGGTTFTLKTSPPFLSPVLQGENGTATVSVKSVGTTNATVTLSVDGLPSGVQGVFSPGGWGVLSVSPGSSNSSTLTLTTSASTPPGPYSLTIRGVSGSETQVIPFGFGVMPDLGGGEGFASLTINPPKGKPGEQITLAGAGFTVNRTITITAAAPGAPVPIDITPGTITVQGDGTWSIQVTIPPAAQVPPGIYTIKATDGVRSAKAPLHIVPPMSAEFCLSLSPKFLKIAQGGSGETTLKASAQNAFNTSVTFGVGDLPPGVTATFIDATGIVVGKFKGTMGAPIVLVPPTPLNSTPGEDLAVQVLVNASSTTPVGPNQIFFKADAGTKSKGESLMLQIVPVAGVSMILNPVSGPADTDISVTGSGFTAGGNLTVTFAGQSIQTSYEKATGNPKQVDGNGDFALTITAPSMAAGVYPVRVTDTDGRSAEVPFGLTPSATGTFILYAAPLNVMIPKGGNGTISLTIQPVGAFASQVNLSVTGLNAIPGANSTFSPAANVTPSIGTPTTATLNINIPANATVGDYILSVSAVSATVSQAQMVSVKVMPEVGTPDFEISAAPATLPIPQGGSGNTTVTIMALNNFTSQVTLAVTAPPNITVTGATPITPSIDTGVGEKSINITVGGAVNPGIYEILIKGTGSAEHNTTVIVTVMPAGTATTTSDPFTFDPSTVTPNTPLNQSAPGGGTVKFLNVLGKFSTTIGMSNSQTDPSNVGNFTAGLGGILNMTLSVDTNEPVTGVNWSLCFPYDETPPGSGMVYGVPEECLTIMYLNTTTGQWITVPSVVDTENNIICAQGIDHLSDFGVGYSAWDVGLSLTCDLSPLYEENRFGTNVNATSGWDGLPYDDVVPPAPPSDEYTESYFYHLGNDVLYQKLQKSTFNTSDTLEWPYTVVTANKTGAWTGNVTITWNATNVANVPSAYTLTLTHGATTVDMRTTPNYTFTAAIGAEENLKSYNFTIKASTTAEHTFTLAQGWNMIGIPTGLSDSNPDTVFTGYTMWTWDASQNKYVDPSTLEAGVGYWILADAAANITVEGTRLSWMNLTLAQGWNMIGIPTGLSDSNPDTVFTGYTMWTWDASQNKYVDPSTLEAGVGYWILADSAATIQLPF